MTFEDILTMMLGLIFLALLFLAGMIYGTINTTNKFFKEEIIRLQTEQVRKVEQMLPYSY